MARAGFARRSRAVAVMAVVVAAPAAGGGCDSGDEGEGNGSGAPRPARPAPPADGAEPADVEAVRRFVVRLFKTGDVTFLCERSFTPRLFRLVYADRAACRKAVAETERDDEPTERVDVSKVEIRGGRATADVGLVGGDAGGAAGAVSLAKRGGEWRLDDLTAAFLRSLTAAGVRNDEDIPRTTGRCIESNLRRLPNARLKRLSFGLLGEEPAASASLLEMWSRCERGRPGGSTLRRPLERAIVGQLRRSGQTGGVASCVIRRLRTTLPDELLIRLSTRDDRASKVRLNREVVAAAVACGVQPRRGREKLSPA